MIEVGTVLEEKVFYLDRAMLKAYADASGDQNPIHQNEEFAVSVGLPNVIAHGMLTMALVGKYVTDWAGGSAAVKEYSARFVKPVIVPADKKLLSENSSQTKNTNYWEFKSHKNETSKAYSLQEII